MRPSHPMAVTSSCRLWRLAARCLGRDSPLRPFLWYHKHPQQARIWVPEPTQTLPDHSSPPESHRRMRRQLAPRWFLLGCSCCGRCLRLDLMWQAHHIRCIPQDSQIFSLRKPNVPFATKLHGLNVKTSSGFCGFWSAALQQEGCEPGQVVEDKNNSHQILRGQGFKGLPKICQDLV